MTVDLGHYLMLNGSRKKILLLFLTVIVFYFPAKSISVAESNPKSDPAKLGNESCLQCHPDVIKNTVHFHLPAKYQENRSFECESCHGAGDNHVTSGGDKTKIKRDPTHNDVKKFCLSCHPIDKVMTSAWKQDAHFTRPDLSCISCHDIHSGKEISLLRNNQNELCLSCHPQIRAEFNRPFHHPSANEQVQCSSCHNPHQSEPRKGLGKKMDGVCLDCHSDLRGPFMWEHKAMRDEDGCLNCHVAHGGSQRKLLIQADNQLCLKCHFSTMKSSSYISGNDRSSRALNDHAQMIEFTGRCATCHGTPFKPAVGLHNNLVSPAECILCHAKIGKIDHTLLISKGRCVDCHTDIHGSNHSRRFMD